MIHMSAMWWQQLSITLFSAAVSPVERKERLMMTGVPSTSTQSQKQVQKLRSEFSNRLSDVEH